MAKKLQIGQRQASHICQMPAADRLAFIAEGLPIIHASAMGFWSASAELREKPREAEVLAGFAKEAAAKILILLDIVRCPEKLIGGRLTKLITRFYGHLDRLIYAQLSEWWFTDVADLRKAVEPLRKAHDLEGNMGEFIVRTTSSIGGRASSTPTSRPTRMARRFGMRRSSTPAVSRRAPEEIGRFIEPHC